MTLLSDIAGLKGENLCSALLAHLMLRSPEARAHVIQTISDCAPDGPIYVQNQFAVFCEESAIDSTAEGESSAYRGRVDLVVETDDAIIGIENKFNAPFQDGQPAGYVSLLKHRANGLSNIRGRDFTYVLVVLAPARREREVKAALQEQGLTSAAFLAWEPLLERLLKLEMTSRIDHFLIRELYDYALDQIGSFRDLKRLLPHLRRTWAPRGAATHREFMNSFIWSLLDDHVTKNGAYQYGGGINYCGFYLRPQGNHQADMLWIGFQQRTGSEDEAVLVASVQKDLTERFGTLTGPYFAPITQRDWSEWDWECFELTFDDSPQWQDLNIWADALKPLNDLVEKVAAAAEDWHP